MNITFNHSSNHVHEAFNLTKEVADNTLTRITYEALKCHLIAQDFEDNGENIPELLHKKTKVLEDLIKTTNSDSELIYMSFSFLVWFEKVNQLYGKVTGIREAFTTGEMKDKLFSAAKEALPDHLADSIESRLDGFIDNKISGIRRFERLIREVKNSNYDYQLFLAIIDGDHDYVHDIVADTINNLED